MAAHEDSRSSFPVRVFRTDSGPEALGWRSVRQWQIVIEMAEVACIFDRSLTTYKGLTKGYRSCDAGRHSESGWSYLDARTGAPAAR